MAKLVLIVGAMLIFGIACVAGILAAEWIDRREAAQGRTYDKPCKKTRNWETV